MANGVSTNATLVGRHTGLTLPKAAAVLVALFPVLAVSLNHGGSTIYTLLLLLGFVYAWPAWQELGKEERGLVWGFLALAAAGALSLLNTENFDQGLSHLERLLRIGTFGLLLMLLVRQNNALAWPFLTGVLLAAFSVGGQALYGHFILGKPQMGNWLYNRLTFGDLSVLAASISVVAAVTLGRSRWLRTVALLAAGIAAYATIYSSTRGAWIFVPVLAALLLWLYRKQIGLRVWVGLLVAVAVVAFMLPNNVHKRTDRAVSQVEVFLNDPSEFSSLGNRFNLWRNSMIVWSRAPLLGAGLGDFQQEMEALVEEGSSYSAHVAEYGHAHNILLDSLATTGIVGGATTLFAIILLPWRYFYRAWLRAGTAEARFGALSGLVTVAAFATFGLTEDWMARNPFVNTYTVYLVTSAAIVIGSRRSERYRSNGTPVSGDTS